MEENTPATSATEPQQQKSPVNMLIIAVAVFLVLAIGGIVWFAGFPKQDETPINTDNTVGVEDNNEFEEKPMEETIPTTIVTPQDQVESPITDSMTSDTVKEFNLAGSNFKFSLTEIRVKRGDTVRINLTADQGFHDWAVDEFNARTQQVGSGATSTVEFVADKVGSFEYYCSVGEHRQLGMVGTLIVEE